MTRVSSNIIHPRAWIHTQFAVANIASAILVSSNPTNLVLAGAFNIKFIHYTANMIVPVVATAIVLFPFLLYIVFADEKLIPVKITMHELPVDVRHKEPINPNIPHARANLEITENDGMADDEVQLLSLEEIMHPFVDAKGAAFGAIVMATTLITLLALNAANQVHQVFWITLPAAVLMFCWDVTFGWLGRHKTRKISREGRLKLDNALAEQENEKKAKEESLEIHPENSMLANKFNVAEKSSETQQEDQQQTGNGNIGFPSAKSEFTQAADVTNAAPPYPGHIQHPPPSIFVSDKATGQALVSSMQLDKPVPTLRINTHQSDDNQTPPFAADAMDEKQDMVPHRLAGPASSGEMDEEKREITPKSPATLVSLVRDGYMWLQETFPTAVTVLAHLPFALVPFAFSMFVLVQALVTKGWVPVFAHGWDHWVNKTGTIGSIGGMGFLSVVLCNVSPSVTSSLMANQFTQFAGTNIGTTILLSRVIQAWQKIHELNGIPISDRTFWATVYSMAIGVNYGAFSAAFSASLAGLLWRDILARKHIHVKGLDFARVNLPIIAIAMTIGCVVLVGEVYIIRSNDPYNMG